MRTLIRRYILNDVKQFEKHRSVFDNQLRYVQNDIDTAFKLSIFKNNERTREIFDIARYISHPSKKS